MGFKVGRLAVLLGVAALIASCEDPLAPDHEPVMLGSQGGPPTADDPQAWASSATQINLSWPDNSNETGWEIHRSTAGREGAFSLLAKTAANVTTYSDVGLKPTTEYCYRIRSFRTSGRKTTLGAFTTTTCATTFGPPGAPSNTSVTPGLYGAVDITWTTTSIATDGFWVERAGSGEGPWVRLQKLALWQLSYRDQGRAIEQQVCYRIVAFNAYGETPSDVDCTTPPAAPEKLAATSPDEQSIALTWEDRSAAEDGYEVQRAGDDIVWSVIATLPANALGYDDRAVTADTRYWYRVRAIKDGGFSQFSATVSAASVSRPPDAPYLAASPASSSVVSVYWEGDSRFADGYRLERSIDDGANWTNVPTIPGQNGIYDEGLPSEQRVCYRAFAFNRLGDSPASSVACTTPPAAPTNLVTVSIDDHTVEHQWTDNSGVEDGYDLWLYVFDGWDYYYYPVSLPANSTSYQASSSEAVYGVVALKDGGYSDWAFPAVEVTAAALQNRTSTGRRPPASAQRTPPVLKSR
jgi:hypothetical protein